MTTARRGSRLFVPDGPADRSRRRTTCALLVGLVSATVCFALMVRLSADARMLLFDRTVRDQVQLRHGSWRGMRGALAYLAIPALFVLAGSATYALRRHSPRAATAYVLTGLGANLTVQAVKHGVLPGAERLNPLSGHVGIAAGVCLGWLAFAPRTTGREASAVTAVVAGVAGGVVLASWHTVPQALASLGIVTAWVIVGQVGAGPVTTTSEGMGRTGLVVAVAALTAGVVIVLELSGSGGLAHHPWTAVALAQGTVASATVLSVGLVLLARAALARPTAEERRENAAVGGAT